MTNLNKPDPFFIADHKAIDFLNSIATPSTIEYDWLDDGQSLLTWLSHADLIPESTFEEFSLSGYKLEIDAIACKARGLRERLRVFVARHAGNSLEPSVLQEISFVNEVLSSDNTYVQIELASEEVIASGVSPLVLKSKRRWLAPESLLLPLVELIAELVSQVNFTLIKNCEGPPCTLWFYDVSKNHARRWCTMSVCGNRAKAAIHRAKKRAEKKL